MSNNVYKSTPRQTRASIERCIKVGLVPMVHGSPAVGKSSVVRQIAEHYNLHFIDVRLASLDPTYMEGLPFLVNGKAHLVPFNDMFPTEDVEVPEGKDGFLILLDELSSAPRSVAAAAYRLILDRMVGNKKLHPKAVMVAAGNRAEDNAIVVNQGTALPSRMVHIEMEVNHKEWMEDVAFKQNFDKRIIGYLSRFPSKLYTFEPEMVDWTYASPRTWEFTHKLIQGQEVTTEDINLLAGVISPPVAAEFVAFTKLYESLVTLEEILKDPEGTSIPDDISLKWATVTYLMEKVTESNLEKLSMYIDRFTVDFRVLFYKAIINRNRDLRDHPAMLNVYTKLAKYLYGN